MGKLDCKALRLFGMMWMLCLLFGSPGAWAVDPMIFGVVTNETLTPIEGTTLDVLSPGTSNVVAMTTTAADGSYSVSVPAGTYDLLYMPPAGSGFQEIRFSGIEILTDLERNIALVPAEERVTFSGTIRDDDGIPIEGLYLHVSASHSFSAYTNSDGAFEIEVVPDIYYFFLDGLSSGSALIPNLFIVDTGGSDLDLTSDLVGQELRIPTTYLDITVVDPSGDPIPSTRVEAFDGANLGTTFELFPGIDVSGVIRAERVSDSEGAARLIFTPLDPPLVDLVITPPETSGLLRKTISGLSVAQDGSLTIVLQPNTTPLTADAGPDQTVETTPAGATIILDGSGSSDPEGETLTYEWSEDGTVIATGETASVDFSVGTHTVTLTVTDPDGNSDSDQVTITVVDIVSPDTSLTSATDGNGVDFLYGSTISTSSATFGFDGEGQAEGISGFECRVDGEAFAPCSSLHTVTDLNDSTHTFEVRAVDAVGNVDPTPAAITFTVSTGGSSTGTALRIPSGIAGVSDRKVSIPVELITGEASLAGVGFSVDFDESCLRFVSTDQDGDGFPDAVTYHGPSDYQVIVNYSNNDTDGEIDVTLFNAFPTTPLSDGTLFTFEMSVTCEPPANAPVTVPVRFSTDPAPSFSNNAGQDVDGSASDGSVTIYGGLRGDCNGSGSITVADLVSGELEIFDGDGDFWLDVPGGTFTGSPVGCDANGDTTVNAADLSCTNRLYFGESCTGVTLTGNETLRLELGTVETPSVDGRVTATVKLRSAGWNVNSAVLSLDLDTDRFAFDPTDNDGDGLPDAVRFVGFVPSHVAVRWDPSDPGGELDVVLSELGSGIDTATLDDLSLEIDVQAIGTSPAQASDGGSSPQPFTFSSSPAPSLGDLEGRNLVPQIAAPGAGFFVDGFESGDVGAWSLSL